MKILTCEAAVKEPSVLFAGMLVGMFLGSALMFGAWEAHNDREKRQHCAATCAPRASTLVGEQCVCFDPKATP